MPGCSPHGFRDARGSFHEGFRAAQFTGHLGYPFDVAQAKSPAAAGTSFGACTWPKYHRGRRNSSAAWPEIVDVLVDLRVGSPTFGKHIKVTLSESNNYAVHVPIGVGHGFVARSETAVLNYLVTEAYNPDRVRDPSTRSWASTGVLTAPMRFFPIRTPPPRRWRRFTRAWLIGRRRGAGSSSCAGSGPSALDFADSYGEHGEG